MRRFHFRLAGLLRLRAQFERSSRRALAAAMGAVGSVEHRIAVAGEGLRQCEEHSRGAGPSAKLARAMEDGLRRHRTRLQNELRAAQAQLDRARAEWLEQRRERQTLLQLRSRRHAEWQLRAGAAEQAELEELSRSARIGDGGAGLREEGA